MTAVVDTHALLWWLSAPDSLSTQAAECFKSWESGSGEALICGVSLWELEDKRLRGKLELQSSVRTWLPEIAEIPWMRLLETTPEIWLEAAGLDWQHRDPADRIIAATGLGHSVPILTKDRRFHETDSPVMAIW
ncbi:MAG: type II toxin-antitoxin system VapC family toxin [Luteolibacter sp.]|uniref:type II toxin-antitoxin system VapC family toxin n=1 Tax=Luteolibacter sp. TaxID=1962973 RepID=UPI003263FDAC